MRIILSFIIIGLILSACGEDKNANETLKESVVNDTIIDEYEQLEFKPKLNNKDTVLFIDNERYILIYTAILDTSKKYHSIESYLDKGKTHKEIYNGYNAEYNITLKNNNGEIVFSKTLYKDSFKDVFDGSILTRSDASIPFFVGFLPTFDSFLFTIDFLVPDSDVGGQCFFMIDREGRLTENFMNNYFGGADCDGEIEIPSNKKFILTCRKILNDNGKSIDISNKKIWQIGTRLINENTILVIQDFNDTTKSPNAKLIDNFGNALTTFTYNGYYEVLGYTIPDYFDSLSNNYFLLDEQQKNLRIINKNNPKVTYSVGFEKMKYFGNDKSSTEIVFDLNTEFSNNTFAFDTLTDTFRHKVNK